MSHFSLLADPGSYAVSDVDLSAQQDARQYWLALFQEHFLQVLEFAKVAYGRNFGRQIASASKAFSESLAQLRDNPLSPARPWGVIDLCRRREKALRAYGLRDPFRHIKQRENKVALDAYSEVVHNLSRLGGPQRWDHLLRGIFAGNIFDLGSAVTMGYAKEQVDFEKVISQIRPRPWRVDNFDQITAMLPSSGGDPSPWVKAVVFVDNAGPDFVLGVMPLVRQLAAHGTKIVLAANELPSLNDITADESVQLVQELAAMDPDLETYVSAGLFEIVSTGNDIPLIDLSGVSDELNEAAEGADLVVLEGMGRTVESNWNTRFSVDSIQICLLKDPTVAARIGGEVFDCVCAYFPAAK